MAAFAQKREGFTVYVSGGAGYSSIPNNAGCKSWYGTYNMAAGLIWKPGPGFGVFYEAGYSLVGADYVYYNGHILYDKIVCGSAGIKCYAGSGHNFYIELAPLDLSFLANSKSTVNGKTTTVRARDNSTEWNAYYRSLIWGLHAGCGYTFRTASSKDLFSLYARFHQDITPFNKSGNLLRFSYSEIGIQLYLFNS